MRIAVPAGCVVPPVRAALGLLEQLEDLLGRLHSVGAGVVVGAEGAEREVGLGSEDEHEERVLEAHVPAEEAQAHGHGDERHRHGGQQLEYQGGEEGQPQRRHGGRAVAVRHRCDRSGLGLRPSEHLEGGQPGHDVEEVAGQLLQRSHAGGGAVLGGGADERHEERDQREADRDQGGADPVRAGDDADDRDGDDDGEEELGEVAREVAVERVDPGRHEHAELTRVTALQPARPQGGDAAGGGAPQLGLGRRRGPVCGAFGRPGQGGPSGDDGEQQGDGRPQRGHRAVLDEGLRHNGGDQSGLGHHQQGGGSADGDGQDHEAARRARVAQQSGVEGPTASFSGRAMGGIPPGRLRPCVHRCRPPVGCSGDARPRRTTLDPAASSLRGRREGG